MTGVLFFVTLVSPGVRPVVRRKTTQTFLVMEFEMARIINKKRQKRRRKADNPFTKVTGFEIIKLTGNSDCWVVKELTSNYIPVRKISYAAFAGWLPNEITPTNNRMRLLRVKQTCGVDQCVNPEHLAAKEKEYQPWG